MKTLLRYVFLSSLLFVNASFAKNLGVFGTIYPIAEEDIREFILKKLNTMQENGELKNMENKFTEKVKAHTLRPTPVAGLSETDEPKTFYYDPSFVLARDIKDAKANVLFPKGLKVNPLEKVKLHSVLFFLNADDKRQIDWAKAKAKKYDYIKYILVAGNIKEAGEKLDNRIYFDQYGRLTRKLGIKHVPCIVSHDGLRLKIQEFALEEKR